MNVLHLIETSEAGGAETIVLSIAKSLRDRGHHSVIGLLETGWLEDELKNCGFVPIILELRSAYDFGCIRSLCKLIGDFRIDLVHSHEFMMNVYGTVAGLIKGIPVITTVHGKNYYWERTRRRVAYRVVSRVSRMVAVSEDLKCFLERQVSISRDRIEKIYNGIDSKLYERNSLMDGLSFTKERLSIPRNSPVIGTVGMLVPVKDHKTILEAAKRVIRKWPDAIFLIVGDGASLELLKTKAHELGLENNVRFTGFRRDVPSLLHIMNVYVCSSLSEGHSLSILEAMAAGKPVIATDVGGNPEVVVDGETGFLIRPGDPEGLASRIAFLLGDQARAHELGAKGKMRVDQTFSLERTVDFYHQLYKCALAKT